MAIIRVADTLRTALAQQIADAIDAGAGAGTLKFYTGAQPADADDVLGAQVLLGTLTFSDPSALSIVAGVLTFDAITEDTSADASGLATWARIEDSDGNNVIDVDVGGPSSGATIELNTTTIVAGGPIQISSFIITIPAG